jgi:hypothetical protein
VAVRAQTGTAGVGYSRIGPGQLIDGAFDPIIDRGLWDRAQTILKERSEEPRLRRGNDSPYLLTSTTRCRRCGHAYVGAAGNGRGGHYSYYRCQGRIKFGKEFCDNDGISAEALEEAVLTELTDLLANTILLQQAFDDAQDQARKGSRSARTERGRIERELRDLGQRLNNYYESFETGKLKPEKLEARIDELRAREAALRERQAQLLHATQADSVEFPEDAIATTRELLETIRDTNPEQAKALVRLLVQEVSIGGKDDIRCTYRMPTDEGLAAVRAPDPEVEAAGIEPAQHPPRPRTHQTAQRPRSHSSSSAMSTVEASSSLTHTVSLALRDFAAMNERMIICMSSVRETPSLAR